MTLAGTSGRAHGWDTVGGWLIILAIAVCAFATLYASFSALAGLAEYTGWDHDVAPALPACVDALGIAAGWVWVRSERSDPQFGFARGLTVATVVASSLGNVAYHVLAAPADGAPIAVTVAVALMPSLGAALLLHLLALMSAGVAAQRNAVRYPPRPVVAPPVATAATPVALPAQVATTAKAPVATAAQTSAARSAKHRATATLPSAAQPAERNGAEVLQLGETKSATALRILRDHWEAHAEVLDRQTLHARLEDVMGKTGMRTVDNARSAFQTEIAS